MKIAEVSKVASSDDYLTEFEEQLIIPTFASESVGREAEPFAARFTPLWFDLTLENEVMRSVR